MSGSRRSRWLCFQIYTAVRFLFCQYYSVFVSGSRRSSAGCVCRSVQIVPVSIKCHGCVFCLKNDTPSATVGCGLYGKFGGNFDTFCTFYTEIRGRIAVPQPRRSTRSIQLGLCLRHTVIVLQLFATVLSTRKSHNLEPKWLSDAIGLVRRINFRQTLPFGTTTPTTRLPI